MSIFINKAKLRKLELMEYLNRFSDPVPIQQALNHFNTTRNAVFEDLNSLQKKYPELTIFQTTKMVYLRIPNNKSIKYFHLEWIHSSIAFRLLSIIFNQPNLDREALARD